MERKFWEERWATRQIGFHQPQPNDLLVAHAGLLDGMHRVYVPLCGKSTDLAFLRNRGHHVIGCEIVRQAIAELFDELGEAPARATRPPFETYGVPRLLVVEGDAFAITPEQLGGTVDAIYDRAALVAVAPPDRVRLVDTYRRVLRPGARMLLVVLDYDQSRVGGPPWAVRPDEVSSLFGSFASVRLLEEREDSAGNPRFLQAGVTRVVERAYAIELPGA